MSKVIVLSAAIAIKCAIPKHVTKITKINTRRDRQASKRGRISVAYDFCSLVRSVIMYLIQDIFFNFLLMHK